MPKYLVVIEQGERNLSAYAPDVPGAVATGKGLEGVRERMGRGAGGTARGGERARAARVDSRGRRATRHR